MQLMDFVILTLFAIGGMLAAQALKQRSQPGKAGAAISLAMLFAAAPAVAGLLLDPNVTPLDVTFWLIALLAGLFFGSREA